MGFELVTYHFTLRLLTDVHEEDLGYPVNTTLNVSVMSDGFSACASMDVSARGLAVFAQQLHEIYGSLSGTARIEEPYGQHMYLAFEGDGRGHVSVKGRLCSANQNGAVQTLEFQNCIDQTELKSFCAALETAFRPYLR